jgi:transcriptional regulator with XRE-family HTH domain
MKDDLFNNVLKLRDKGLNYCEISRRTGVNRRTAMDWCKGKVDKNKLKNKHNNKFKVDTDTFIQYVEESFSVSEVLKKCKLVPWGANYKSFYRRVDELMLDTSHFVGQGYLKGKSNPYISELSIEDAFIINGKLSSYALGRKIIKYKLKEYVCECCVLNEWMNKKISLHLDHIDGNNTNNLLLNLRWLCPNCHSQTDTYCGKNK